MGLEKVLNTFMVLYVIFCLIISFNDLFGPIGALIPLNMALYILIFKRKTKSNVNK